MALVILILAILEGTYQVVRTAKKTRAQKANPTPDWLLTELFYHLGPDLDSDTSLKMVRIGQQILDKLSIGQVRGWGRTVNVPTLVEIPKEYWQHVEFTYLFFGPDEEANKVWATKVRSGREMIVAGMGLGQLRSVELSKAECLRVWPKAL